MGVPERAVHQLAHVGQLPAHGALPLHLHGASQACINTLLGVSSMSSCQYDLQPLQQPLPMNACKRVGWCATATTMDRCTVFR